MTRTIRLLLFVTGLAGGASAADHATYAETTGYRRTPDYAATIEYLRALEEASPSVRLVRFGTTPLGRDMYCVVVSRDGAFAPEAARRTGKLIVLIQNGIHSGEIDGKDACLALIRDVAVTGERTALLDRVILLIIPVFNVDGHEMMSPYNRINQNGPEEMGFRATAQNYNLNRDYLKLDAPEMHAFVALWNAWDPDFFVDNHITDGADFQYAVTYTITQYDNAAAPVRDWGRNVFVPEVTERMEKLGEPIFPYVITMGRPPDDGLIAFVEPPRFSTGYAACRNRPGLLVETHMLKDYERRVVADYRMMVAVLEVLNARPEELRRAVAQADSIDLAGGERTVGLDFTREKEADTVLFKGYEHELRHSEITGGDWIWYDTTRPSDIHVPFFGRMRTTVEVTVPAAYLVPPQWTDVIDRLRVHGIEMMRLADSVRLRVETYRFDSVQWAQESHEGHQRVTCRSQSIRREVLFPAGTVYIPTAQRNTRLIVHALEPEAPDSFLRWGFFNLILEQKEYAESYAAEKLAGDMLAADADLKAEYEERLQSDSAFAADPEARRDFFYKRSPWAEPVLNVYPVGRLTQLYDLDLTSYGLSPGDELEPGRTGGWRQE